MKTSEPIVILVEHQILTVEALTLGAAIGGGTKWDGFSLGELT